VEKINYKIILSIMEKKFEITKFEVLETSSEMLKGGFSTAYAGGKKRPSDLIEFNSGPCNPVNNCIANCIVPTCRPTVIN
jgi:hypothetical protein